MVNIISKDDSKVVLRPKRTNGNSKYSNKYISENGYLNSGGIQKLCDYIGISGAFANINANHWTFVLKENENSYTLYDPLGDTHIRGVSKEDSLVWQTDDISDDHLKNEYDYLFIKDSDIGVYQKPTDGTNCGLLSIFAALIANYKVPTPRNPNVPRKLRLAEKMDELRIDGRLMKPYEFVDWSREKLQKWESEMKEDNNPVEWDKEEKFQTKLDRIFTF